MEKVRTMKLTSILSFNSLLREQLQVEVLQGGKHESSAAICNCSGHC